MRLGSFLKNSSEFPGIIEQAITYGEAYLKYKIAGSPNVSNQIQTERVNICLSCDRLDKPSERCLECGCPIEEKTLWATESCPLNKWSVETNTNQIQSQNNNGCGCRT